MKQQIWVTAYGLEIRLRGCDMDGHMGITDTALDMSPMGWFPVMTIDVPDECLPTVEQARMGAVAALKERERETMATYEAKLTEIRARIANLLCLENSSDTAPDQQF